MDFVNTGLELPIVKMPTITPSMNNHFGSSFNNSVPASLLFYMNENVMVFYLYGHKTSLNYVYLHFLNVKDEIIE